VIDHEHIHEILAGYALQALSKPDAAEADRLLEQHVPGCEECRETLRGFDAVTSDLGLAADPIEPPDTLLVRLHRDLEPRRDPRRARAVGWFAAAAAFVGLVVTGGLALTGPGVSGTLAASSIDQAIAAAASPGAQTSDLGAVDEVTLPDRSGFYLWGEGVPPAPAGQVYRLWLLQDDEAVYVGEFAPDPAGIVAIEVTVTGAYEGVLVTTEDAGTDPGSPSSHTWSAVPSI
jgi:hypothetical protein